MVHRGRAQRLRARGDGDRRRAVHPGPPRATHRQGGRRRPAPRPVPGARFGLPRATWRCGTTSRSASASCRRRSSGGRCRDEFLHYVRIREWQDVYTQIRQVVRSLKIADQPPAGRRARHPPGAARRAAPQHRQPRRRDRRRRAGQGARPRRPGAGRVRRPAQRALLAGPELGAGQEAAPLGDGRRDRRDQPVVGPHRRHHPPAVRSSRPPPTC